MGIFKKRVNEFPTDYTCMKAVREGGVETRLSMLLMGFGNIVHKQFLKGLLFLAAEAAYLVFMAVSASVLSVCWVRWEPYPSRKYGMRRARCICTQKGTSRC